MQHLKTSILAPISKPDSATNLTNMPDNDNNGYLRLGYPLAPSCVHDHLWWSLFENHRIVICHCVAEAQTQQVNVASSSDGSSEDHLCDANNATMGVSPRRGLRLIAKSILSKESTLTAKLGSLWNAFLQAAGSTGNRFHGQNVLVRNPFRMHSTPVQTPFRIHTLIIQNPFTLHSDPLRTNSSQIQNVFSTRA